MARSNYKKDESIKVIFKATAGAVSVNVDVFDETDVLDAAQSGAMVQAGVSDRWSKSFIPNANGDWSIEITDSEGAKVIKHYSVGAYNIGSIGSNVQSVESKVDLVQTKVDSLQSPPMIG